MVSAKGGLFKGGKKIAAVCRERELTGEQQNERKKTGSRIEPQRAHTRDYVRCGPQKEPLLAVLRTVY